jgi:hypothetical protein
VRLPDNLFRQKGDAKPIGDKLDNGMLGVRLLQNPDGESCVLAGPGQPFPDSGMGFRGPADEKLRREVGEPDVRILREWMEGWEGDEHRIVRHAFGEQIVAGERGAQADEAELLHRRGGHLHYATVALAIAVKRYKQSLD